jgi:hypothetical protein
VLQFRQAFWMHRYRQVRRSSRLWFGISPYLPSVVWSGLERAYVIPVTQSRGLCGCAGGETDWLWLRWKVSAVVRRMEGNR